MPSAESGRLIARTALKDGSGEIPTPEQKEPEAIRVVIGPPIDREDEGEILTALIRLKAPERLVRPDEFGAGLQFPVDRVLWACWLRFCLVRGTLLRRVTIGGLHFDLPVCGAEIEIYEVDPVLVIFPTVPDYVLERVRDLVRKPWPPPPPEERFPSGIPFPPIPPGPDPDPAPFIGAAGPLRRATLNAAVARRAEPTFLADEVRSIIEAQGATRRGQTACNRRRGVGGARSTVQF